MEAMATEAAQEELALVEAVEELALVEAGAEGRVKAETKVGW